MTEEMTHALVKITELVAGRVGEHIFYPNHDPLPAEHDNIEARALASVVCTSPSAVDALIRFCEAEAHALINSYMGVAKALIDALVEHGTLDGEQADLIISDAIAAEMLAVEHERRREMQARVESAQKFREVLE